MPSVAQVTQPPQSLVPSQLATLPPLPPVPLLVLPPVPLLVLPPVPLLVLPPVPLLLAVPLELPLGAFPDVRSHSGVSRSPPRQASPAGTIQSTSPQPTTRRIETFTEEWSHAESTSGKDTAAGSTAGQAPPQTRAGPGGLRAPC